MPVEDAMSEEGEFNAEPMVEDVSVVDAEPLDAAAGPRVASITEVSASDAKADENPLAGSYVWTIHNYTSQAQRLVSEVFTIGGYEWNLLLFRQGSRPGPGSHFMSLFLNAAESDTAPPGWMRTATFKLWVVNQHDPSRSVQKEVNHTFTQSDCDWGFSQMAQYREIEDPNKGFVVDGLLQVRVDIVVERLENAYHDSKRETGFVGLRNQGATCYMNSLLQTLFHVNRFRQAVYHMPTAEEDDPQRSIPLALQSMFYKMQFTDTCVSTKDLTKSFGWDTVESFMQHDIQELNRVLTDKLDEKMKWTKVESTIKNLFEGSFHKFIKCINVDYERRTSSDTFLDLQLDVRGCASVQASFEKFCEVERMEGRDQYQSEVHGLQDARMGVLFDTFPPVLQLHLKRFDYDYDRDMQIKINDRYEFPDELDLDAGDGRFLAADADRSVRNLYRLHSVLVHSGGVHGGHYYAFIRPDGQQWLKFDDDKVTKADARKALDENFGGEDENPPVAPGFGTAPAFKFTKYSNAYMLVYVRACDWDQVMCEVSKADIQDHVAERLEREHAEKERRRREKLEAHLYLQVRVATSKDLKELIGSKVFFDLVDFEQVKALRVKKQMLFRDFRQMAAEELGVPVERQRWWKWAKRQNGTLRPTSPLADADNALTVMDVCRGGVASTAQAPTTMDLWLEEPSARSPETGELVFPTLTKQSLLLLVKFYDPANGGTLRYAGHIFGSRVQSVATILPLLAKRADLPDTAAPLEVWEEIKSEPAVMCERLSPTASLAACQLEDGDILAVQLALDEAEARRHKYPCVPDFLEYVKFRWMVTFRKLEDPKEEGVQLELSREMPYDRVATELAAKLGLADPQLLRFTQQNPYSQVPKTAPLKWRGVATLAEMLQHFHTLADTLYYEVLDLPLPQLEQLKTLKVYYHGVNTAEVGVHMVRLPKESTAADVCETLRQQLPEEGRPARLRLLEVFYCKIYKIFPPEEKIDTINDTYWTVRAEPDDDDEGAAAGPGSALVHCYHYHADAQNHVTNFGNPFLMRVGERETLAQLRPRMQAKLGVAPEEFAKWRCASLTNLQGPKLLEDEDVVATRFPKRDHYSSGEKPYLGLEHADTGPRRPQQNRYGGYERAIKIA
ncbi:hypothetical protein WJX81_005916 [Elliptochloris bilobata]|uniref:ubiquitinyl hydrolase 1 n=1 Tax=Elliptochloris bilobata TaxID=381761 RepID=A0AAW1QDD7_9CHLO